MAFRNSVKATLLFEPEQPRSRSDEPRPIVETPAPAPPAAPRPSEATAQRASENAAPRASVAKPAPPAEQRPSESTAQRPLESTAQRPLGNTAKQAEIAPPPAANEASLAATWHARAEALSAMAGTLPCESSWSLISKIANLYDELARDAGWTEPAALAPGDVCLEEPPVEEKPQAEDEPQARAPQAAAPPPEERITFSRRPLPLGRRFPRRRA